MGLFTSISSKDKKSAQEIYKELTEMGFVSVTEKTVIKVLSDVKAEYKKNRVTFLGEDFELVAQVVTVAPIPVQLEDHAQRIAEIFSSKQDWSQRKPVLREIGKKLSNNHRQLIVAHRARWICKKLSDSGNIAAGEFSLRHLEFAWDGIGGWRS